MSNIFGITGTSGNSFIEQCLGNSSSSSSSSTSNLMDYSLIQSGAYKKLMTAYYESEAGSSSSSSTDTDKTLSQVQTDAQTLAKKASTLSKTSFTEDNRETILKNVKAYVESYNDMIDVSDDVNNTSVLRSTLLITKQTAANENLLSQVGITIGKDNKLEIDEDTLNEASLSTLKTLFSGTGSYASYITTKSAQVYATAANALNSNGTGSAYTSSGSYTALSTGSIIDSLT